MRIAAALFLVAAVFSFTVVQSHSHSHAHSHGGGAAGAHAHAHHAHQEGHGHSHGHSHSHGHAHGHGLGEGKEVPDAHLHAHKGFYDVGKGATATSDASFIDQIIAMLPSDPSMQAILATVIISIAPIFGVYFMPIDWTAAAVETIQVEESSDKKARVEDKDAKPEKAVDASAAKGSVQVAPAKSGAKKPAVKKQLDMLKVLVGFAVGGLLGDVFLHLIPHALLPHDLADSGGHAHAHTHDDGHDHAHATNVGLMILAGMLMFFLMEKFARMRSGSPDHGHGHSHSHSHVQTDSNNDKAASRMSRVTGMLNIIADAAHNFTDGMAIAASFLAGGSTGFSTSVAVFFHEIPHEIGDYAILIKSGYTKTEAMLIQLLTAAAALTGTLATLWAAEAAQSIQAFILPFAAGGFIYIAMVNIIPELLTESNMAQLTAEVVAMAVGVYSMVVIGWLE